MKGNTTIKEATAYLMELYRRKAEEGKSSYLDSLISLQKNYLEMLGSY